MDDHLLHPSNPLMNDNGLNRSDLSFSETQSAINHSQEDSKSSNNIQ